MDDLTICGRYSLVGLVGCREIHEQVAVWHFIKRFCLFTGQLIDIGHLEREFPHSVLMGVSLADGQNKIVDAEQVASAIAIGDGRRV